MLPKAHSVRTVGEKLFYYLKHYRTRFLEMGAGGNIFSSVWGTTKDGGGVKRLKLLFSTQYHIFQIVDHQITWAVFFFFFNCIVSSSRNVRNISPVRSALPTNVPVPLHRTHGNQPVAGLKGSRVKEQLRLSLASLR